MLSRGKASVNHPVLYVAARRGRRLVQVSVVLLVDVSTEVTKVIASGWRGLQKIETILEICPQGRLARWLICS